MNRRLVTIIRWRRWEDEVPTSWTVIWVRTVEKGRPVVRSLCGYYDLATARHRGYTAWADPAADVVEQEGEA